MSSPTAREEDYRHISVDVDDGVATLTLDREKRLNAFTTRMGNEIITALDRFDADDSVRVVVITGRGRGFCAGADLGGGGASFDGAAHGVDGESDTRDLGGRVTLRLFESTKPIIAAINGAAVGVGATMTLPMDVRLASTDARFGFVFTRRGIVPEACSSWFLPRVVGISQAMEWVASGRVFPASEALDGGLVSRVVEPADLLPVAMDLAREIADNTSAVSVALSRQMMWRMLGADHPMEAHKIDSRAMNHMGASSDAYEGVKSFLDKRPPDFTMRPSEEMGDFYPWWDERPFE